MHKIAQGLHKVVAALRNARERKNDEPLKGLPEAIERIKAKTPISGALKTSEWARVPLALRERAMFSARVESARLLSAMQDKLERRITLTREAVAHGEAYVDRSSFIADMRKIAEAEGLGDKTGTITDIRNAARLGLIFDFQTQQAAEYARYAMGQDADMLDAFPAQELVRIEERELPRDWLRRWAEAGGKLFGGRMIALKTDPIWQRISRFGTPYPPFDFGSGMGVEDVSREEAEALGVIQAGQKVAPSLPDFNAQLEASATGIPPEIMGKLMRAFGNQIEAVAGKLRWRAQNAG